MSWLGEVYLVTNKSLTETLALFLSHTSMPRLLNLTLIELQFKTKQHFSNTLNYYKHTTLYIQLISILIRNNLETLMISILQSKKVITWVLVELARKQKLLSIEKFLHFE